MPSSTPKNTSDVLKPTSVMHLVSANQDRVASADPIYVGGPPKVFSTTTTHRVNQRLVKASTPLVGIVATFLEIAEPVIAPVRFCRQHLAKLLTTLGYLLVPALSALGFVAWLPGLATKLQVEHSLWSAPLGTWVYLICLYLANIFVWLFLFFLLHAIGAGIARGWQSLYHKGAEFLPRDSGQSTPPAAPPPVKPNFFSRARPH